MKQELPEVVAELLGLLNKACGDRKIGFVIVLQSPVNCADLSEGFVNTVLVNTKGQDQRLSLEMALQVIDSKLSIDAAPFN